MKWTKNSFNATRYSMAKCNFFVGIAATAALSMVALPTMIHAEEVNAAHRRLIPKHPNQPVRWPPTLLLTEK
jgi:hypothetical protein